LDLIFPWKSQVSSASETLFKAIAPISSVIRRVLHIPSVLKSSISSRRSRRNQVCA